MELPEETLAYIFSFLALSDKCNAFAVCKSWSSAMTCPSAWSFTEIRCSAGSGIPQQFSVLLPWVRHLKLIISLSETAHRKTGLWVLQQALARGDSQLQALCVDGLGNPPLFYAGEDLLEGLVHVLTNGSRLTVLDLKGLPFTLNDNFVKSLALLCPGLQSLFINNASLVRGVTAEAVREVLKLCPGLTSFGLFQASLSEDVLKDLLLPTRRSLKRLDLRCERSLKYVPPLSDHIWLQLSQRHPNLRVDLKLDHTLPELLIPGVLQPSIPVRQLRLCTWTWLLEEVPKVTQNYSDTLEMLDLQTPPSPELNAALIALATRCRRLREVNCYCVVSEEVIRAFCTYCPDLQKYTLKTCSEPHPWTGTKIK